MFQPAPYTQLNARQQENYRFHKVAARLPDYGFNCLRLTDDWQRADFIAYHISGQTFLKVQLKGRLCLDKKYVGKDIPIAFLRGEDCFAYPHDELLATVRSSGVLDEESERWRVNGQRHWPTPPGWGSEFLSAYKIYATKVAA
ncbi:hypothetical protein [Erythrobacter sp.]|uniref:hypothetical protein n=1 Tax=Erythrobacter sp. TaxID=1042 RepID=UPI003C734214